MAFDEDGQADNLERRKAICQRAYDILVDEVGFPAEDIIFDPNIFAVATGIEEHAAYGIDFIEATRWIKENLPGALVSGGVSNVSFSFRGNNPVREAIHAVFLYHAIQAGHGHGHRQRRRPGRLRRDRRRAARADRGRRPQPPRPTPPSGCSRSPTSSTPATAEQEVAAEEWRSLPVGERITHALVKGIDEHAEADTEELRAGDLGARRPPDRGHRGPADGRHERRRRPVRRRQDVPAAGGEVGPRDEEGGRLPHPVHRGREDARPSVAENAKGKIVMATVKGDVHDIGKNIVGVVLQCNNYEVVDLGVMVPAQKILDAAQGRARPTSSACPG